MLQRRLGRSGASIGVLGVGGGNFGLAKAEPREAIRLVRAAIELGANYVDVAPGYGAGLVEETVGEAIVGRRDRVFLATKVEGRSRVDAIADLERSFRRLRTNYLDLVFLHAVNDDETLDEVLDRHGALAALRAYQAAGRIRRIGIAGHRSPEVLRDALEEYAFDAVMMPINPADRQLHDFGAVVIPVAERVGAGVVAMKVYADGLLSNFGTDCLRYALAQPVSCAVVGMSSIEELLANVDAVEERRLLSDAEEASLLRATRPLAFARHLWWRHPAGRPREFARATR